MKVGNRILTFSIIVIFVSVITVGCMTTKAQKGAGLGAAGGSLAGLAIGSLTGSAGAGAAIGAVAGTAVGYVVGNEMDKKEAKKLSASESAALEKAHITNDPKTAYHENNSNPLVGTSWRIVSLKGPKSFPDYHDVS